MFTFTSIHQFHQGIQAGNTTCLEATEHFLANIEAKKHLNAFVEVYADEAIARAKELDEEFARSGKLRKLHGVVLAIKDVISYEGHRLSAASGMLSGYTALYTASALQYLIDEGVIVIGNCNCDEFAMGSSNQNSFYGAVKNAADETKVPGGSSGGSAVAVQGGMCMVSLGTDTGGSVRQPADFCGIVGFKPGYGSISRYGVVAYASSFDQIGIFSRTVADAESLFEAMAKKDALDSTMNTSSPAKVGNESITYNCCFFTEMIGYPELDPEIKQSVLELGSILEDNGLTFQPEKFELMDVVVPAYYVLTTAEASSNLSRYDGVRFGHRTAKPAGNLDDFYSANRSEGFGTEVKRRIMLGSFVLSAGYYDAYFAKAQQIRRLLVNKVHELFEKYDFIIMPVSPGTAFPLGHMEDDPVKGYMADIYTVFANLTGSAGIALPLFSHTNNLPYGVQILCKQGNEIPLLKFSERVMNMMKPG